LDAGSGPIQYPEYLTYSKNYDYRVCLDISRIALKEARERIGEHGLFVVGDIARLPFAKNTFSGIVSLHTIHHLPGEEQERSFLELHRVLRSGGKAAVVYSWGLFSPLMRIFRAPIRWIRILRTKLRGQDREDGGRETASQQNRRSRDARLHAAGTFTFKHDYGWVRERLEALPGFEIRVWRSVSTAFLRTFIHGKALGRFWLRIVFVLEELAPRFFGRIGQYPLILFNRPEEWEAGEGRSY
jgi:SAM-dependent methyltransferase